MIRPAEEQDQKAIFDAIGTNFHAALYLYIDIRKYGFSHPALKVWVEQEDGKGPFRLILMQYYTGMVLYSRENNYEAEDVASLLCERQPAIISGMAGTLAPVAALLPKYASELGVVGEAIAVAQEPDPAVGEATPAELDRVAALLAADEGFGGHSQEQELAKQLRERQGEKFGRNYVLRLDGKVVAHAATYAELNDIAVVSGVVTDPEYRGRGLMKRVYATLCRNLLSEGKRVFACYFVPPATALHHSVGFIDRGAWEKLVRKG